MNEGQIGFYLTIDGLDGVGKTHAVKRMEEKLSENYAVTVASALQSTDVSRGVRTIFTDKKAVMLPMAEAMLLNAAHYENYHRAVLPAVLNGNVVIGDRSTLSALAHQGYAHYVTTGDKAPLDYLVTHLSGMPADCRLIITAPREKSRSNLIKRGDKFDRIESHPEEHQEAVSEYYETILSDMDHVYLIENNGTLEEFNQKIDDFLDSLCEPKPQA